MGNRGGKVLRGIGYGLNAIFLAVLAFCGISMGKHWAMLLIGFALAAKWLTGLRESDSRRVAGLVVTSVALGLLARYLLEYGEVSWYMNFTPGRVLLFLALTPAYTMAVYQILHRLERRGAENAADG